MAQIEKRPAPVTVSGAFVVSRVCAVKIFQRIKKFEKLIAASATAVAPSFALHFVVAGRVPAYFALVAAEQVFWRDPDYEADADSSKHERSRSAKSAATCYLTEC